MDAPTAQLVAQIHHSPGQIVLAVSGGGSRAIADLLEVPGASQTVLEAVVPYAEASLVAWLGSRPEHFCASQTARAMAVAALRRAWGLGAADGLTAGIACTASLVSDHPKRGEHRAHVALQTATRTVTWSLTLRKDARSRADEEEIVRRMVLNAVADAGQVTDRLDLPLLEGEEVQHLETVARPSWQGLFRGQVRAVREGETDRETPDRSKCRPSQVIFPGAFNPLHDGHRRMMEVAREVLGTPVALEISILNVDKPPLDYTEIERRLAQFPPEQGVWLTRAATFEEKSRLFPEATFVVGVDTLRRIVAARYYPTAVAAQQALEQIVLRGCRFLVFGRHLGAGFVRLGDLELPPVLQGVCQEVPPEQFRKDVSSTRLRQSGH